MITITESTKSRFRLQRIIADFNRDNWTGVDVDIIIKDDDSATIKDTTQGGPNRMEGVYAFMGNAISVTVQVHAELNSKDGIKDISVTVRDARHKEVEISKRPFCCYYSAAGTDIENCRAT